MSKKSILITGALGHIGSRLIRNLTDDINKIYLLDNLDSQRYCSLFDLNNKNEIFFIEDDVRTADFDKYLKNIDIVVHLAAITNAEASHGKAEEVEAVNFYGLQRIADACLRHDVKLLFPSTTSVYGSQENRVDENCLELKPQSPYAESKLNSERYLAELGNRGLNYCVCRFGTIFGTSIGMRFHTAVNKFIWQAQIGAPLTVWQTAWQQKRPYLDLDDCISAINLIIEKNIFDKQVYNVVTKNYTVEDIVKAIQSQLPAEVKFVDSPIMNQLSYEVDGAKLMAKGFKPAGSLELGIKASFELFKGIKHL